jgi:hypothetical protein
MKMAFRVFSQITMFEASDWHWSPIALVHDDNNDCYDYNYRKALLRVT